MVVRCESCGTKFKIDETKLKKPVSKVRCSRCKHVFTIELETPSEEEMVVLDPGSEDEPMEEPSSMPLDKEEKAEPKRKASTPKAPKRPKRVQTKPPVSRPKIFTMIAMPILLIAVAFGYYFYAKPTKKAAKIPTKEIPAVTILPKTEAYFIENVNVGQMLVVQGEVVNKGNYPISFIMLEGKVYGPDNKVLLNQRFYAGNILTKDELSQLPVTEIQARMLHREGDNLSNVHIKPGDKVPFMVVFYNLPPIEELTDYSVEYVNAEIEKPSLGGRP